MPVRLRLTLTKALEAKGTSPLKRIDLSFGNPLWFANTVHKDATIKEMADVVASEIIGQTRRTRLNVLQLDLWPIRAFWQVITLFALIGASEQIELETSNAYLLMRDVISFR